MKKSIYLLAAVFFSTSSGTFGQTAYEKLVYQHASTFHKNFSAKQFDNNGPLVNPDIHVNSNAVILEGRDNFVARIKRYDGPFPDLQLKDKIIIQEGSRVAVQYVMQGMQIGDFGQVKATNCRVEAYGAEFFEFDENALMKNLITITKTDDLTRQVTGKQKIDYWEVVELQPVARKSKAYEDMIRKNVSQFHKNFSAGEFDKNGPLVADSVHVNSNGVRLIGRDAFINRIKRFNGPFPGLKIIDEQIIVQGDRAAILYTMEGKQTGPLKLADGSELPPTGKMIMQKGAEFFQFDADGKLIDLVTISDGDQLAAQLK